MTDKRMGFLIATLLLPVEAHATDMAGILVYLLVVVALPVLSIIPLLLAKRFPVVSVVLSISIISVSLFEINRVNMLTNGFTILLFLILVALGLCILSLVRAMMAYSPSETR